MKSTPLQIIYAFLICGFSFSCNNEVKNKPVDNDSQQEKPSAEISISDSLFSKADIPQLNSPAGIEAIQLYLAQYGYLDIEGKSASKGLYSLKTGSIGKLDSTTIKALKTFQQFFGLPPTGKPDEATFKQIEKPRCGFKDVTNNFADGRPWGISVLSYSLAHHGMPVGDLNYGEVLEAIKAAFKIWDDSTFLSFNYSPIGPGDMGSIFRNYSLSHIGIRAIPIDGPLQELAHAYFSVSDGMDLGGDIRYDGAEQWSVATPTPQKKIDLISVTAHEIGHSLGLDHSSDKESLMYPIHSVHRYLSPDDLRRFHQLYKK